MPYIPQDKWALKAKKEGYAARSAYKLIYIYRQFGILNRETTLVLDLGCSPGSWVEVAREKIGQKGAIIGVDIKPVEKKIKETAGFIFLQKDIYDADLIKILKNITGNKSFDTVLSDAAPKTTGQKDIDQWRAHELALRVFDIIKTELKKNGNAIIKIFEGPDTPELLKIARELFKKVHLIKPEASMKGNKEAYIVAKNKNPF